MFNTQNHSVQHRSRRLQLLIMLVASTLLLSFVHLTQAAVFSPICRRGVGDAADLQAAVNIANTNDQDDTLYLADNCVYTLTSTLTIKPDGHTLTIQGGTEVAISGGKSQRPFVVESGAILVLNQIIVRDGTAFDKGGGILNNGTLTMNGSSLFGNRLSDSIDAGGGLYNGEGAVATLNHSEVVANKADHGAGIYNDGTMTLTDSHVAGNEATGYGGGGINNDGVMTLANTSIVENKAPYGGGLYNFGTVTLTNSSITGNMATDTANGGGGIFNDSSGSVVLSNTLISENRAYGTGGGIHNKARSTITLNQHSNVVSNVGERGGGGIYNTAGTVKFYDSYIYNNHALSGYRGGGIYNHDKGSVEIKWANITFNSADYGGGLYNEGTGSVSIYAVTFVGNIAGIAGGNLFNHTGTINLVNDTVVDGKAEESGGGLYNYQGIVNIGNTIIANSVSGGDCFNSGSLFVTGVNLIEDIGCGNAAGFGGDPKLGAQVGDPAYLPLLPSSPAIDAGTNAICTNTDQRHENRPRDGNNDGVVDCDLGAYELIPLTTPTSTKTNTPGGPTATRTPSPTPTMTYTPGGPTVTPTSTLTVTPTATFEPGTTELLTNGDFEAQNGAGERALEAWTLKNPTGDKVKCNKADKVVAYTGTCAFRFKGGAGEQSKLVQTISTGALPAATGDTITLKGWINASSASVSGSVTLVVKYADPALLGEKVKLDLQSTAGYEAINGQVVLKQNDIAKVKLQIKHKSANGKVYADSFSLIHMRLEDASRLLPLP